MTAGLKRWALTAGMLMIGAASASAADLGGNCCADLEERIAELEATTARKGNRKVSLTISGWVNQALFAWDDGTESNVYVGTNSLEQDRFRFVGEAKVSGDVSAGYTLEIGVFGGDSKGFSQDADNGGATSNTLVLRKSNWWLKSKSLGKVTVGNEGTATYHLLDDADSTQTRNFADAEAAGVALAQFQLREDGGFIGGGPASNGGKLRWTDLLQGGNNDTPGQNGRRNIVRYDSPEFAGFVFTTSWGQDDQWGAALTYKNTWGDFDIVAKAGYEKSSDGTSTRCNSIAGDDGDCEWWGAASTVMHKPTGLYVYGAYGDQRDASRHDVQPTADEDDTMWLVQGGIEQKWWELGKTTVFAEYRKDDGGSVVNIVPVVGQGFIDGSEIENWAGGVVQKIDNADMSLYAIYRHAEGDFTTSTGVVHKLDDFDMVITGAKINF